MKSSADITVSDLGRLTGARNWMEICYRGLVTLSCQNMFSTNKLSDYVIFLLLLNIVLI